MVIDEFIEVIEQIDKDKNKNKTYYCKEKILDKLDNNMFINICHSVNSKFIFIFFEEFY